MLPEIESLLLLRQLASGLQTAHEHGLVHRDLKPGNIFLDLDHYAKIGDFGCALPYR